MDVSPVGNEYWFVPIIKVEFGIGKLVVISLMLNKTSPSTWLTSTVTIAVSHPCGVPSSPTLYLKLSIPNQVVFGS